MHADPDGGLLRFGPFSFDPESGDLVRNGSPVLLPPQPTQVLGLLARHAGSIVTRDRIRDELWDKEPPDPDQAINSAIAEIRSALGDNARNPEYVQTVPRKGYRLLVDQTVDNRSGEAPVGRGRVVAVFGLAVGIVLLGLWFFLDHRGGPDSYRLVVVPARVTDAVPGADSLANRLTSRLVSDLTVADSRQIEILRWQWDMKFDRENRVITRDGVDLDVDYLIESSVDRDDDWTFSVSVYSVEDGTQLWHRRYSSPLDASSEAVDRIVTEMDSLLILNLDTLPGTHES